MKIYKILLIAALSINYANATVESGNSFLKSVQSGIKTERQHLLGYVAGLYDAYEFIDVSIANCLGSEVRMSQLVDALEIYLKNNPQIRHLPMFEIFPTAVKQVFKCK